MELSFLPTNISSALEKTDLSIATEIRLRVGQPIIIKTLKGKFYLSNDGLTILNNQSIKCAKEEIENTIINLTENSLYAFNDRLKNGFLTTSKGVRIGLAGDCVFNGNEIVTIKNVSSLNIRIPNIVFNCSKKILNYLLISKSFNSLIVSPPGFGKTTLLKDLAVQLNKTTKKNILIIDERGEFIGVEGENIDIIKYSNKYYAFNYSIRSMSPEIVITDELITKEDWKCVLNAVNSGVNIIASIHSSDINELINKEFFIKDIFDYYFILDNKDMPGIVKRVYNKRLELI